MSTYPKLRISGTAPYTILVSAFFVIAFSGRIASVWPQAGADDGSFMRAAINIADGRWLGHYGKMTLAKGPGYPLFLVIAKALGLNFLAASAFFYLVAVLFFSRTVAAALSSKCLFVALITLLLFLPALQSSDTVRVIRDLLATTLALVTLAAAIDI